MICKTRDFGEFEYREEDVIHFSQPPFGFEEYTKYLLLHDDEGVSPFVWLQSVEDENLCFILLETNMISDFYNPIIPEPYGEGQSVFVICSISDDITKSTINLKSPVVIDETNKKGFQIILQDEYPIRHYLMQQGGE